MKIVTTFPEPYGSYYELNVAGTCDIGLMGSSCSLDAGKGLRVEALAGDNREMNTGSLIVRSGELDLNSSGNNSRWTLAHLQVGGSGSTNLGQLKFSHDLTVDNITGEDSVYTVEAQNTANLSSLKMFGEKFPACDASDNEIRWQKLKVNDEEGVFLVCGAGGETIEVNEDCCSITDTAKFKECIFANYAKDSPEYICAAGGPVDTGSRGTATGATACAYAIGGGGRANNWYLCLADFEAVKNGPGLGNACLAAKSTYASWINGGYVRWACDHITPVLDESIKDDTGNEDACTWEIAYYEKVSEGTTFACGLMSAAAFIESCSNPCPAGVLPGVAGGEGDGGDECFLLNDRYYTTGICSSSGGKIYNTYEIPALICK